ncbi:MAG: hypothetical protein A2W27_04550 [Deltaproteobacteria bacterium RBG_16_44_11]|nr:MAG: hypothetical protein A2W27_04550 [Deltaproteobacteria bacterium RBG_16_44_11]
MKLITILACFLITTMSGCVSVSVMPSGSPVKATPRPNDCPIEFFRIAKPDRPFFEIATISAEGPRSTPPAAEQEKIRRKACELGADAVIVTRESAPQHGMIGVAIKYK